MKFLKNEDLLLQLRTSVASERKITAEIVELIKECDQRKVYLKLGHTSLFSFLVDDLGYTASAAQRRIDAARMSRDLPEISQDLSSGALNLSQVSLLSQCLRQRHKENPEAIISAEEKRDLLTKVKSQNLAATELIFAQDLDLQIQAFDKKHHQQDDSVRMEATFSKDQMAALDRVKELVSHQLPNPSLAEIVEFLCQDFINRKDPQVKKQVKKEKGTNSDTAPVVRAQQNSYRRPQIPVSLKRQVFQRDLCCRWQHKDGSRCGSKFQLQVDHRQPIWAGGDNRLENLQMLCSIHNRLKYSLEAGLRRD